MKKLFLLSLPVALLASACTVNQGNFTVISNRVVDLKDLDLNSLRKIKNVEGDQSNYTVFLFTFGVQNPHIGAVLNESFKTCDADLMVDAQCHSTYFWFPLIFGYYDLSIEGDAVKTRHAKNPNERSQSKQAATGPDQQNTQEQS